MSNLELCPNCGGPVVEEEMTQPFQYAYEGHPLYAMLTATYVGFSCKNPECLTMISDQRGEEARELAVERYLEERKWLAR